MCSKAGFSFYGPPNPHPHHDLCRVRNKVPKKDHRRILITFPRVIQINVKRLLNWVPLKHGPKPCQKYPILKLGKYHTNEKVISSGTAVWWPTAKWDVCSFRDIQLFLQVWYFTGKINMREQATLYKWNTQKNLIYCSLLYKTLQFKNKDHFKFFWVDFFIIAHETDLSLKIKPVSKFGAWVPISPNVNSSNGRKIHDLFTGRAGGSVLTFCW
jgi:hypothetical protein